jgi:hypothetical protein
VGGLRILDQPGLHSVVKTTTTKTKNSHPRNYVLNDCGMCLPSAPCGADHHVVLSGGGDFEK